MGAWGYGVLDSDSASDVLGDLAAVCRIKVTEYGVPYSASELGGYEFTRSRVNDSMGALTRLVRRIGGRRKDAWPVLAVLVMHVGARMSKTLRTNAANEIMLATRTLQQEGWRSPSARMKSLEQVLDHVLHYQSGQPINQNPPRLRKKR